MEAEEGYPPGGYTDGGGVRERTLLCPIQEEDTESTASAGSSVTGIANNTNKRSTVINNNNSVNQPTTPDTQDTHEDIQEEVHDGHYFIKVRQNLNFPPIFFTNPERRIHGVCNRKYLVKMQMLVWEFIRKVIYPLIYPITL